MLASLHHLAALRARRDSRDRTCPGAARAWMRRRSRRLGRIDLAFGLAAVRGSRRRSSRESSSASKGLPITSAIGSSGPRWAFSPLIGLLSIRPTLRILAWRRLVKRRSRGLAGAARDHHARQAHDPYRSRPSSAPADSRRRHGARLWPAVTALFLVAGPAITLLRHSPTISKCTIHLPRTPAVSPPHLLARPLRHRPRLRCDLVRCLGRHPQWRFAFSESGRCLDAGFGRGRNGRAHHQRAAAAPKKSSTFSITLARAAHGL